jgi:hypothetical protein
MVSMSASCLKGATLTLSAHSLNVLEEHSRINPLTTMIQSVNRFLLDKFILDFKHISPESSYLDQV